MRCRSSIPQNDESPLVSMWPSSGIAREERKKEKDAMKCTGAWCGFWTGDGRRREMWLGVFLSF